MDLLVLIVIILIPLILSYLLLVNNPFNVPKQKGKQLPPGPYPWPVVGNLLQLGREPHITLANMAHAHGPLISLKLGLQLLIVASSPATAAQILKTHDGLLSARYISHTHRIDCYINYSLVFAECNEQWKRLRTFAKSELFTTRTLDSHAHLRETKVGDMVRSLSERRGSLVKTGEVVFATVFNILGNVFFSRDVFDLQDEDDRSGATGLKTHISRILELSLAPNLADFYPFLAWMDIQRLNRESSAFVQRLYGVWEGLIREREDENPEYNKHHDFLNVLLGAGITGDQLKALLSDMFVAGTDTTTTLVDWTMSELIRNPRVMQKVREELERAVGHPREGENLVKESYLNQLSYLEACIKESLRLHPPVPLLLPRRAVDDCQVMNYTIPKDCRLMINVWAIGRDPQVWEDPMIFSPDRFLHSCVDYKGNDFELSPFGGGRRMCPGLPLATRVVKLILASLIHTFHWDLPNGMHPSDLNMDERFGLTLERKQPLLLVPK